MLQELFRIPLPGSLPDIPIWSFGLMMVIGFLAALQLAKYLSRRAGLDPELFVNAGLIALVAGVVGARLSHVLENLGDYTDPNRSIGANLLDAINIRSGGLTYYGGFLLAFPILVWYALKHRIPVRVGMDIIAPCLMIGLAFGRIGCFLNGCCYGKECELPWAVQFPYQSLPYQDQFAHGEVVPPPELLVPLENGRTRLVTRDELKQDAIMIHRTKGTTAPLAPGARSLAVGQRSLALHPAQLYSALTAFLIAGITLSYYTLPHAAGRAFALMMMLEGVTRFVLEMLRTEPPVWGTPLSISMWLGLGLVIGGIALWVAFGRFATIATESESAPARPARSPAHA
jgi:phosphatidylglycerol:prolipoprotein diacylglycerol transferase